MQRLETATLTITPLRMLRQRSACFAAAAERPVRNGELLAMLAFIVAACALYGAVLAGWRSPRLALYVACKLPLVFLGTTAIVAFFNWMASAVMGAALSFRATLFTVCAAMTMASWILLALTPVALFFTATAIPDGGDHAAMRTAHNLLLMTHISVLAAAGVVGNAALLRGLRWIVPEGCRVGRLCATWIAAYAFVGCQMSWILRPFVGSPFFPVEFVRADALERNFYEFVFTEVLPYLFGVQ